MKALTKFNSWGQKKREKVFAPLFDLLGKLKITPNMITAFRALAGPAFVFLFIPYPRLAVLLIIVAALLDWFDGGLARHIGKFSDRGKFWDVLVDHTNAVFPVFTLLLVGTFNAPIIGYFLLIGPILYLLATIKESEKSKTDWLIHPYYTIVYFKPIGLLAFIVLVFFGIDWMDETILGLNIAMTLWALYYVGVLVKRWKHL